MPLTYNFIASSQPTTSPSTINFTGIPQTYTDLVLKVISRDTELNVRTQIYISINGVNTNYAEVGSYIAQSATGAFLGDRTDWWYRNNYGTGSSAGTNIVGVAEFYFPQYSGSNRKTIFGNSATLNTTLGTTPRLGLTAGVTTATTAITSIQVVGSGAWVTGSRFFLYGIN